MKLGYKAGTYDRPLNPHAVRRLRQRGIRTADLALLLFGADRATPVGSGCVALTISRNRGSELVADGYSVKLVERAVMIAAVESPDGEIKTVLRPYPSIGRRYRKAYRATSRKRRRHIRGW